MSISRFDKRRLFVNDSEIYSEHFDKRSVKQINQFYTIAVSKEYEQKSKDFIYSYHIWTHGDRLFKLAHKHYGDSELWWVLAFVNRKPTDSHFKVGDLVLIPQPLHKVLEAMGV